MTEALERAAKLILMQEHNLTEEEAISLINQRYELVTKIFFSPLRHMKSDRRLVALLLEARQKEQFCGCVSPHQSTS
jgi:hypothetical protein